LFGNTLMENCLQCKHSPFAHTNFYLYICNNTVFYIKQKFIWECTYRLERSDHRAVSFALSPPLWLAESGQTYFAWTCIMFLPMYYCCFFCLSFFLCEELCLFQKYFMSVCLLSNKRVVSVSILEFLAQKLVHWTKLVMTTSLNDT
jgi:hypothetical protein